jgi:putative ABC transport system permease protein
MAIADRRAREKESLRQKILDTARDLFVAHGYEGVTLRKIAEVIEYAPGTIYSYFKDKGELMRALCIADWEAFEQSFPRGVPPGDALDAIGLGPTSSSRAHQQVPAGVRDPKPAEMLSWTPKVCQARRSGARQLCAAQETVQAAIDAAAAGDTRCRPRGVTYGRRSRHGSRSRSATTVDRVAGGSRAGDARRADARSRSGRESALMNRIALKMLMGDRLKYYGLIAGIAFATMLILQQSAILIGFSKQTGAFIRDTAQADLWIMDPQVRFSQDLVPVRDTTVQLARGVPGVDWAVPLHQGFLRGKMPDGTRFTMIIIGLDDATLMGGPPIIVDGQLSDLRRDKAVFIQADKPEKKLMMKRGGGRAIALGDRFTVNDHEAIVMGTYRGRESFFWEPVLYTTYSRALSWAPRERNTLAFVLVKVKQGEDVQAVKEALERKTGLAVRSNSDFIKLTADYILNTTGILVNFGLAVALGVLIGSLVAGQTFYNFTLDNLRHYGALKAMGVSNRQLITMVLLQAGTVAVLGYCVGAGLGSAMAGSWPRRVSPFSMPWQVPAFRWRHCLGCALAAWLSLRRVFARTRSGIQQLIMKPLPVRPCFAGPGRDTARRGCGGRCGIDLDIPPAIDDAGRPLGGKTTLISIIAESSTSGGGWSSRRSPAWMLTRTAWRDHIGFVFQAFNSCRRSPRRKTWPSLIRRTAPASSSAPSTCRAGGRRDAPSGSRAAAARRHGRALVRAQLVVCDEPTSSLDHETGHAVMQVLRGATARERALVVVTHDARIFEFADRIARMDDGRIVEVRADVAPRRLH